MCVNAQSNVRNYSLPQPIFHFKLGGHAYSSVWLYYHREEQSQLFFLHYFSGSHPKQMVIIWQ